uniref:DEAD-box helicase 47 n=1 Tax=Maylandia zebra TaxID=106582 RepID=A0A3P9D8K6_9CICH
MPFLFVHFLSSGQSVPDEEEEEEVEEEYTDESDSSDIEDRGPPGTTSPISWPISDYPLQLDHGTARASTHARATDDRTSTTWSTSGTTNEASWSTIWPTSWPPTRFLGWKSPTKIQIEAIPVALQGKDVIGLAETGSGKTVPSLCLSSSRAGLPQRLHTLVLTPTRELAFQISEQFEALGSSIGVKSVIVDVAYFHTSHVCLCSPTVVIHARRLIDHLETQRASLYEILNMDFETESVINLEGIPRERRTFLFSATMTKKVSLESSLKDPVKCRVHTCTCADHVLTVCCDLLKLFYIHGGAVVRNLGITNKRLGALNKFKSKSRSVCWRLTYRGDYIHRVGRTARADDLEILTFYDVELFQRIEKEEVMMLVERVSEAQRFAKIVSHPVFIVSFSVFVRYSLNWKKKTCCVKTMVHKPV